MSCALLLCASAYAVCAPDVSRVGKVYVNPYDFGRWSNFEEVFGREHHWLVALLPSLRLPPVPRVPSEATLIQMDIDYRMLDDIEQAQVIAPTAEIVPNSAGVQSYESSSAPLASITSPGHAHQRRTMPIPPATDVHKSPYIDHPFFNADHSDKFSGKDV